MARSPDCMLRIESLSWHSGTPEATISGAIQSGEMPATRRPRRVKAADFERWLEAQAMDGGKRHKRRGELLRWRQSYPEGEAAPLESYPLAEAPIEAGQFPLAQPTEAPQANGRDYRDMLVRTIGSVLESVDDTSLMPSDVRLWWSSGPSDEWFSRRAKRDAAARLEIARKRLADAEADAARLGVL